MEESANAEFERDLPRAMMRLEQLALNHPPVDVYNPSVVTVPQSDIAMLYKLHGLTILKHPGYDISVDRFIGQVKGIPPSERDRAAAFLLAQMERLLGNYNMYTILVINDTKRPLDIVKPFFTIGTEEERYHIIPVTSRVTAIVIESDNKADMPWVREGRIAVVRQNHRPTSHISHLSASRGDDPIYYACPDSEFESLLGSIKSRRTRPPHYRIVVMGSRLFVVPLEEGSPYAAIETNMRSRSDRRDFEYMRGSYESLRPAQFGVKRMSF